MEFMNSASDMKWLRDIHLPGLGKKYKSAVIYGNEDFPTQIHVYTKWDPSRSDMPTVFKADHEGIFRRTWSPPRGSVSR